MRPSLMKRLLRTSPFPLGSHPTSDPGGRDTETGHKILQVAVVTDVDGGAGMNEVGHEEVKVQVSGGVQGAVSWICQQAVVLHDGAE
jgi:hypothetical protein